MFGCCGSLVFSKFDIPERLYPTVTLCSGVGVPSCLVFSKFDIPEHLYHTVVLCVGVGDL